MLEKGVTVSGNGRTARLLMNLLLLRQGYPPVAILPEQRREYHDRLEAVRVEGARQAWHEFCYARLLASLEPVPGVLHGSSGETNSSAV